MRVIALLSGGKDSCFSMLECIRNGHEIVALANLQPPPSAHAGLNSYTFQTAGFQLIDAIAECIGVPLFKREINGGSKERSLLFRSSPSPAEVELLTSSTISLPSLDGSASSSRTSAAATEITAVNDEIDDLELLLRTILSEIPADAVCSGALLSTYQRARVEHVSSRLNLTSLAFLWRLPQRQYLARLLSSGMEAVMVKVAAHGLTRRHIGRSLAEISNELTALGRDVGLSVCGEGGEYETLVLDCPLLFAKGKVVVDEWEVVGSDRDDVWRGVPKRWHIEPRSPASPGSAAGAATAAAAAKVAAAPASQWGEPSADAPAELHSAVWATPMPDEASPSDRPGLGAAAGVDAARLEADRAAATALVAASAAVLAGTPAAEPPVPSAVASAAAAAEDEGPMCVSWSGLVSSLAVPAVAAAAKLEGAVPSSAAAVAHTLHSVLSHTSTLPTPASASTRRVCSSVLLLPAAALEPPVPGAVSGFVAANKEYSHFFGTGPPSRACVGLGSEQAQGDNTVAGPWSLAFPPVVSSSTSSSSSSSSSSTQWAVAAGAVTATFPPSPSPNPCSYLHVQSLSSWAPANIGPYAQAFSVRGLTFFAGQIGLAPSTMQLLPSPSAQLVAAAQHVHALAAPALGGSLREGMLAGTLFVQQRALRELKGLRAALADAAAASRVTVRGCKAGKAVTNSGKNGAEQGVGELLVGVARALLTDAQGKIASSAAESDSTSSTWEWDGSVPESNDDDGEDEYDDDGDGEDEWEFGPDGRMRRKLSPAAAAAAAAAEDAAEACGGPVGMWEDDSDPMRDTGATAVLRSVGEDLAVKAARVLDAIGDVIHAGASASARACVIPTESGCARSSQRVLSRLSLHAPVLVVPVASLPRAALWELLVPAALQAAVAEGASRHAGALAMWLPLVVQKEGQTTAEEGQVAVGTVLATARTVVLPTMACAVQVSVVLVPASTPDAGSAAATAAAVGAECLALSWWLLSRVAADAAAAAKLYWPMANACTSSPKHDAPLGGDAVSATVLYPAALPRATLAAAAATAAKAAVASSDNSGLGAWMRASLLPTVTMVTTVGTARDTIAALAEAQDCGAALPGDKVSLRAGGGMGPQCNAGVGVTVPGVDPEAWGSAIGILEGQITIADVNAIPKGKTRPIF